MMKKLLFAITLLCLSNVNAQDVRFGIKSGLNVATLNGGSSNIDSRLGLHVGVAAEVGITDRFSIQPEVLFSQQGGENSAFEVKLDYLAVPIMAKYYVAPGFSLEAGPQFSFLTSDEAKRPDGSTVDTNAENFDFALGLGLGYQTKMGLFFQTRYNLGLTNVDQNPDVNQGVFQLSVGFQF